MTESSLCPQLRVRKGHTQIPVDHANTLTEPLDYEQKALLALFASVMNTHIQVLLLNLQFSYHRKLFQEKEYI